MEAGALSPEAACEARLGGVEEAVREERTDARTGVLAPCAALNRRVVDVELRVVREDAVADRPCATEDRA